MRDTLSTRSANVQIHMHDNDKVTPATSVQFLRLHQQVSRSSGSKCLGHSTPPTPIVWYVHLVLTDWNQWMIMRCKLDLKKQKLVNIKSPISF